MPTSLRQRALFLGSAVAVAFVVVWFIPKAPSEPQAEPPVTTIPPLRVDQGDSVLIWGGWRTVAGHDLRVTNAVEIICSRELQTCMESYAELLQHDAGQDLAAKTYNYTVTRWDEQRLEALSPEGMGRCVDRILHVDLTGEGATLLWRPSNDTCEGDVGKAILVGDPL